MELIPQYKVTYPEDTADFEILDADGNSISNSEELVRSGDNVTFKVKLTNSNATELSVKNGKQDISGTAGDDGIYTYTLSSIAANANISVNAVPKKFDS